MRNRIDNRASWATLVVIASFALLPLGACSKSSSDGNTPSSQGDGDDSTVATGGNANGNSTGGASTGGASTGGDIDREPCEDQTCSGHGTCVADGDVESCECDEGYSPQGLTCARACTRPAKEKCFEGEGLDPGDSLVVNLRATRTSGVAPLFVFFDATQTTSTETDRPFHDLAYCWNFGDGGAGCFGTSGLSKNEAFSPVAGHVFETAGTYEVQLTVRDKEQRESVKVVQITVEDPDEFYAGNKTSCVSGEQNFDGCPDGATQVAESELENVQSQIATGRRILFRRGETFTGGLQLREEGPGTIGAFPDEGAAPRFLADGNGIAVHDPQGRNLAPDWRVMDLEIDGQSQQNTSGVKVEHWPEELVHLLFLRLNVHHVSAGIRFEGNAVAIQDTEVRVLTGGAGGNLLYGSATDLYIGGSVFNDSTGGEHAMRFPHVVRSAMSHNYIGMVPDPRLAIKLHAPDFSVDPRFTEYVSLTDNVIEGNGGQSWLVDFGPQNEVIDQRVRNILFEYNTIKASNQNSISVLALGEDITIRQNLFTRPSANGWTAIDSRSRGIHPDPNRIYVYGNTAVTETGALDFCGFGNEVQAFTVANNLIVSPEPGSVFESSVDGGNVSGNVIGGPQDIVNHPPADWEDFRPSEGSSAQSAADPAWTWFLDFERSDRPSGAAAGALEP